MQDLKKKLEEEIAALENELRIQLPREISKARAHGDLRENAEYHAAKERQGRISTTSPIGRGLLGKQVGDTVKVQIPGGVREMEIIQLVTIHDASE